MIKSRTTKDFRQRLQALPNEIKAQALKAYRLFQSDPNHTSLQFKKIRGLSNIYSARVGLDFRVLGVWQKDYVIWYWIGSHAEYDRLVRAKRSGYSN